MSIWGTKVWQLAKEAGIRSKTQLAELVGVNRGSFSRWLVSESEPNVRGEVLLRLAEVLGADVEEILPEKLRGTPAGDALVKAADKGDDVGSLEEAVDRLEQGVLDALAEIPTIRKKIRELKQ